MGLKERLRSALRVTAKDFYDALTRFEPTSGDKAYPERMVSYYYIQALAKAMAPASVLLELPVTGKRGQAMDNHVDAVIFNDREVVVAEFKLGWAPSYWMALARDLARLQGPVAQEIFGKFTDNDKRQRRPFIFLGADCWYRHVANVWKSGSRAKGWTLPSKLRPVTVQRDYLRVYPWKEGTTCDGYYFTWALLPYNELAA